LNIKIAKHFALHRVKHCILAGTTPNIIRTEEAVKKYFLRKGK